MKADGTYIGQDGRTYGWKKLPPPYCRAGIGYDHCVWGEGSVPWPLEPIAPSDWPAAKAALDALIEEEAGEWVYVDEAHRVRANGETAEYLGGRGWTADADSQWRSDFYRKGREVALEQVRELVSLIETPPCFQDNDWYKSLQALAKALKPCQ